jgi:hypothetical protein
MRTGFDGSHEITLLLIASWRNNIFRRLILLASSHGQTSVSSSAPELLEEKGVITQEEWEQRIKKNLKA